jgi:glycine cleavage system H lipoate-binding protein
VQLLEAPVSVHNNPYDADNWFYRLKLEDPGARTWLMTAAQLRASVGQ